MQSSANLNKKGGSLPEIYDKNHTEKIIRVILGESIECLLKSVELLERVKEELYSKSVSVFSIYCDLFDAGKLMNTAFVKAGEPKSLLELFEPAVGHYHMALQMFSSCFEEWKSGRKPPGLTHHALLYIGNELDAAIHNLRQLHDIVFDKMNGLADALREVDSIRVITDS